MTRKHWYRIHIDLGCPVCGGGEGRTRERVYGRRPKRWQARYEYHQYYDWCNER